MHERSSAMVMIRSGRAGVCAHVVPATNAAISVDAQRIAPFDVVFNLMPEMGKNAAQFK
jgi:hypothetical protein